MGATRSFYKFIFIEVKLNIYNAIRYLIKSVLIECRRELHKSINTRRQGSFRAIFEAVFHRAPEQISVNTYKDSFACGL